MQKLLKLTLAALTFGFAAAGAARAQDAVITEGKINVRGRPSLIGEVVTQLDRGDKVKVIELIKVENPKPGDPAEWARIKLPENTPVWVFSPYIKDGVVTASRLNVRGGPGENYSILGRIDRGTEVKPIRTIEEWMEIEQPPDAYAFIDSSLISTNLAAVAPVVAAVAPAVTPNSKAGDDQIPAATVETPSAAKPEPGPSLPAATNVAAVTPRPAPSPAQSELQPPIVEPIPEQPAAPSSASTNAIVAANPEPAPATPRVAPPATVIPQPDTAAVVEPEPVTAALPSEPLPKVAEPLPEKRPETPGKRLVRREGIVRPTKSIQAPTWYELVHPETKATINYLHAEKLGLNLKEFRGRKVVVSGEEAIDPRWPNTPILELETLDIAP